MENKIGNLIAAEIRHLKHRQKRQHVRDVCFELLADAGTNELLRRTCQRILAGHP